MRIFISCLLSAALLTSPVAFSKAPHYVLHVESHSIAAQAVAALEPELKGHLPHLNSKAFVGVAGVYSARRAFCRGLGMALGRAESEKRVYNLTPKQNQKDMNATLAQLVAGMGAARHPNPVRKYWLLTPSIRKRIIQLIYFDPTFAHATTEELGGVEYYCLVLPDHWSNK